MVVRVGAEVLSSAGWAPLHGLRVAALVHPASVLPGPLTHVVDALNTARNVTLACVLAPEHGFRGDRQASNLNLNARPSE